jgi:hypothetical protein
MSNELERDRAVMMMVMNLESFGVDGVASGYDETETAGEPPSSTNPQ